MPRTFYAVLLACAAAICAVAGSRAADEGALSGTFTDWSRHPAISYSQTAHDPVSEVAQQMRDGTVVLQRDGTSGYLRSVLDVLHVQRPSFPGAKELREKVAREIAVKE